MSTPNTYAIVDLETTGGYGDANKITEIAVVITDGVSIIEEYESLVNPERSIPTYVSGLTGITDRMVADAPKFYEIAKQVYQLLQGHVFVAHNVGFDHSVLKYEYESLGGEFNPKKLCTVRLSRKAFPGYKSYSLGNICESLNIPLQGRHRAMGDAKATYYLFKAIHETGYSFIEESLNVRSKEATLPPNVNREEFEALPNKTGVYYFLDENREIIYIGKAIDIKKRVYTHFQKKDNRSKTQNFRRSVCYVDYTLTGSELIALLYESAEIKRVLPKFNRAQRKKLFPFGLYSYEDNVGYKRLMVAKVAKNLGNPISIYANTSDARNHLFRLKEDYALCAKLCGLQKVSKGCFDYQIKKCFGACVKEEEPDRYNERVYKLIEKLGNDTESMVILDRGRNIDEQSFVLIEEGIYKGYGFIDKQEQIENFNQFADYLTPQNHNKDVQRIINMQLKKQRYKIIKP